MEAGLSDQTKSPRPVRTHAVLSVRVSTVRDLVFFSSHLGGREQVDNRYVLKKLKALLLAVLKKDWYRLPSEDEVKDDVSAIKVCDTYLTRFFSVGNTQESAGSKHLHSVYGGDTAKFPVEMSDRKWARSRCSRETTWR